MSIRVKNYIERKYDLDYKVAIGFLKDNVDISEKIMYYLIKHKTN